MTKSLRKKLLAALLAVSTCIAGVFGVALMDKTPVNADATTALTATTGECYKCYRATTNGFCSYCSGYQKATDTDNDGVYEISNGGQLYWFAALVNGDIDDTAHTTANAELTADIYLNADVLDDSYAVNTDSTFREWTNRIGHAEGNAYNGTFDGNLLTIHGLYTSTTGGGCSDGRVRTLRSRI